MLIETAVVGLGASLVAGSVIAGKKYGRVYRASAAAIGLLMIGSVIAPPLLSHDTAPIAAPGNGSR